MFCYLKFAGEEECVSEVKIDEMKSKSVLDKYESKYSKSSLVSARYKNKVLLLNPDCYIQILIDYIYEETKLEKNVLFDLCDETGAMLEISTLQPCQSALEVMKPKQLYYIILYEKNDNGSFTKLHPYLHKSNKQELDFFLRFQRSSSRRISGGMKKSSSRIIRSSSKQSNRRKGSSLRSKASNISA